MQLTTTSLGGLTCRALQASDDAPEALVVLCHGFGAPGDDLVPIGAELISNLNGAKVRFVFPEAPLSLAPMGYGAGRAWWMLDVERMANPSRTPQQVAAMRAETPEGLPPVRRSLMAMLDEATRQAKLPMSKVVLGGFSQGAMLATDVALRLEEAPAALCIFSGTLLCEPEWTQRAPRRRGLSVVQSHGRSDPLLPFSNAEALRDLLLAAGLSVRFLAFNGPHTIPIEAVEALAQTIETTVGTK